MPQRLRLLADVHEAVSLRLQPRSKDVAVNLTSTGQMKTALEERKKRQLYF